MLNIFDVYDQQAQDLHYSLVMSGYKHPTLVLNENGFLPASVTTPYAFFTGDDQILDTPPLYFNQVKVPKYWEIKSSNTNGEIFNQEDKKANIFYAEPTHRRHVRSVEWLDKAGVVRLVEFYNKHGRLFAQGVYNQQQAEIMRTYYDQAGAEVVVENYVTGDIILNYKQKVYIFKKKLEFVLFYLKEKGYDLDGIIYNSLALPFQISHHLDLEGKDTLFWQEPFHGSIPGNMSLILNHQTQRSNRVIIPDPKSYQDFIVLNGGERDSVKQLGYLYPLKPKAQVSNKALVFTNSDQLEEIGKLTSRLPEIQFHIAALTEMSPKLMTLGQKDNVYLYPNVTEQTISRLWKETCFYLDINHGNEILSANRMAFEHCMPILAFRNTSHSSQFILQENLFAQGDFNGMIFKIRNLANQTNFEEAVAKQLAAANHTSLEKYQEVLGYGR
ncbi:accessory Sec system glycosylation chaperone GtfB [Streptococcus parauberis]|uniref:UDP-N-acetylglucosamine--peptide N-acetylglucosaminyltransferase stabilizing protein GtfB n=1 Tax=Streptococcus parauberis TaxID=1348 RepID=A0A854WTR0_9STRE|nr:accessory Sec system glycosylation chaperone GtfB [Streptococcus parauberis]PCH14211.1 Glycosyltransferase-stabilizing protein Gtf2 [Streptococcus parauberis]RFE02789.1 Glycosyltransferase-stabilizing protein Gtf2 [Streptococcus parauberis]